MGNRTKFRSEGVRKETGRLPPKVDWYPVLTCKDKDTYWFMCTLHHINCKSPESRWMVRSPNIIQLSHKELWTQPWSTIDDKGTGDTIPGSPSIVRVILYTLATHDKTERVINILNAAECKNEQHFLTKVKDNLWFMMGLQVIQWTHVFQTRLVDKEKNKTELKLEMKGWRLVEVWPFLSGIGHWVEEVTHES